MSGASIIPAGYAIRPADIADAPALRVFGRRLLGETEFFLRDPDERARDDAEMARIIRSFEAAPDALLLNAWITAGDPVAEGTLIPGPLARTRATASVGVGVLRAHWGRGLARALMQAVEAHARARGLRRLELTVFAPNERARALYDRLGYAVEGVKRRSVDLPTHGPTDEILMAKLLDAS